MTDRERAIRDWQEEQARNFAAHFPLLGQRYQTQATRIARPTRFGYTDALEAVFIELRIRMEHAHFIGASGSGKSTLLEYLIKQDINNGHGIVVLDPHGGHKDSLFNKILDFIREYRPRLLEQGKVHIIAPNTREYVVGFNPLARLPGMDLSVIADALAAAFERVWGADFHDNPNILTMLRATFITLAELGMNLTDAKLLYDPQDRFGVRARALTQLTNQYARDELQRIHELSLDPRMRQEFNVNVTGPNNRINDFVSSDAIAQMLAMNRDHPTKPTKTLDLPTILDQGHVLLVDLQPGLAVSEQNTNLLGTILLRYLFQVAKLRRTFDPFFVYVDECHHYMTEDIPRMLAEMRKYGVSVNMAHQWLSQLGKPGDPTYDALIKGTLTKVIFRIAEQKEAEDLAQTAVPLDLEVGVEASKRPVQIGHAIGELHGWGEGESRSETEGVNTVESATRSRTDTIMHGTSTARIESHASGANSAEGHASMLGHSDGVALQIDPLNRNAFFTPPPIGQTLSTSNQSAASRSAMHGVSDASGEAKAVGESSSEAVSVGEAVGRAVGRNTSTARSTSRQSSTSEALIPQYEERHMSWHSKDNVLYKAARTILSLPTGRAILYSRGTTTTLNVPDLRGHEKKSR